MVSRTTLLLSTPPLKRLCKSPSESPPSLGTYRAIRSQAYSLDSTNYRHLHLIEDLLERPVVANIWSWPITESTNSRRPHLNVQTMAPGPSVIIRLTPLTDLPVLSLRRRLQAFCLVWRRVLYHFQRLATDPASERSSKPELYRNQISHQLMKKSRTT